MQQQTIKQQLEPHIRALGVAPTAARARIQRSVLSEWLSGRIPTGSKSPRTLSDSQLERLVAALGCQITLTQTGEA